MLFPFVTSLYVARVLSPTTIGEVSYANNLVQYFVILAFLGIPTYGMREIAKARDSKQELDKLYSELFTINGISTLVFASMYYCLIIIIPACRENILLHSIVGLYVIMNAFGITWLFEGIEEYGYISLRNLIFKVISIILIIFFVKSDEDMLMYAGISVLGSVGNNVLNMIYSRKFVSYTKKDLNLKQHLKPIFILAAVNIAIEIYTLVDTTMLGTLTTKDHVAFYTYASRINKILLQITTSITMVLVPRISYYYKEKKFADFNTLLTKGFKILLIIAFPTIAGIQFTSKYLIVMLYGEAYVNSAIVERILCINLLISPIGYLLGSRVLLVSNKEKKMVACVGLGAIINILGNAILIPRFEEVGAAVASVISEFFVMLMYVRNGKKIYRLDSYSSTVAKVMASVICEIIMLLLCKYIIHNELIRTICQVAIGALTYVIAMYLLKDELFVGYIKYGYDIIATMKHKNKER